MDGYLMYFVLSRYSRSQRDNRGKSLEEDHIWQKGFQGRWKRNSFAKTETINFTGCVQGPVSRKPRKLFGRKAIAKSRNWRLQSCFIRIFLTWKSSLHTRSFRCIHLSVFRHRCTKNGFMCPKSLSSNGSQQTRSGGGIGIAQNWGLWG